jgi:nitronate monooxygenase
MTDFLKRLGIEHPIIQAPMGGGFTPPELVAAASNAGALGSIGAPYLTPAQIAEAAEKSRALTAKPFNINLFAGGYAAESRVDPAPMMALLADVHRELGIAPPVLPPLAPSPLDGQLEAVLAAQPKVFSFTFGIPPADALARMKQQGIIIFGTATTVGEAQLLAAVGVDVVVAQGEEAGAHRGTFAGAFEDAMVPTLELVDAIVRNVKIPVIASGGLMDGRDIAKALKRGAVAAQLGTAFLTCPECGAPKAHKQALLNARADTTVITRAFSGRHARGLRNAFIDAVKPETILPFIQQNDLTRPMRGAAAKLEKPDYLSLWAGRGVTRIRQMPAAELIKTLVAEIAAA